ncbi:serine/threonine protein kinase [Tychonema sp. LEGE 07199]|uniref:serine/threonine protein kinase n=1 Tax=Tychonema sp. LEGE 07199 TaxID=1828668 RepID=UPI001880898E|nr:serine/threonine-protein kinase [Tychonema sp. LEGE 07199]MBE9121187.1 serine/threonine protein kinase [Tychonema sp. LEGE 07199]
MNAFTDFSTHGYQIERELGHNSLGGRVTYLAKNTNSQKLVVIKQFQFAQLGASWTEYEAYEQEIKVLQSLNHPGIPRYLDAFGTDSGFCMVQEYKNAESAIARTFSPPDIKQIAIGTLEILAYLQSQKPPVIHRDIKPENLLIDDELNVYLVDFGFARLGGGNIAASSVVKGTMGFMPPEQMFNRELTKASDLYGLGATLICLLTGTKSVDVGNLIDDNYRLHFRHLVPPLQQGWMNWLERMVAPRLQDRYKSAAETLAVLQSLDVSRLPKVRLERDRLELTATEYGEIITQNIEISNPIPDTILAGRWEVAPHPNDPPHTPYDHSWISFEPQSFESNNIECQIRVDTEKLLASQTYKRQILLRANSEPETHTIELQVTTPALPVPQKTNAMSVGRLAFMCSFFIYSGFMLHQIASPNFFDDKATENYIVTATFVSVLFGFSVAEITSVAKLNKYHSNWFGALFAGAMAAILSLLINLLIPTNNLAYNSNIIYQFIVRVVVPVSLILLGALVGNIMNARVLVVSLFLFLSLCGLMWPSSLLLVILPIAFMMLISALAYAIVNPIANNVVSDHITRKVLKLDAAKIAFLTAGFCTSLGAAFPLFFKFYTQLEWVEPMEMIAVGGTTMASLAVTAIPLIDLIVFKPKRIIAKYRKSKPNLIKP